MNKETQKIRWTCKKISGEVWTLGWRVEAQSGRNIQEQVLMREKRWVFRVHSLPHLLLGIWEDDRKGGYQDGQSGMKQT